MMLIPARRRAIGRLLAATLVPLLPSLRADAQGSGSPSESAVKAAFLLNFTAFVEWPAAALDGADSFIMGVYGDDAVASDLERLAADRRVRGLPVVVRRAREPGAAERVHLAYVGSANEARVRDMAARLRGPVLLVTHAYAGLEAGAVLNFVVDEGRVRFEASQRVADQRGLTISSRLLAVAMAVEGR